MFVDPQENKGRRAGCHAFAARLQRERTLSDHGEGMRSLQGPHAFAVIRHDALLPPRSAKAWHPTRASKGSLACAAGSEDMNGEPRDVERRGFEASREERGRTDSRTPKE